MRILICDDDPLAIEQIHKNLKSFFTYKHIKCPEVISYSCGEDLLNDTGNNDIVFLDIEMPDMNGIYVGNELKKSNPAVSFLLSHLTLNIWMRLCVFTYSVIFPSLWNSSVFSAICRMLSTSIIHPPF